jgi:hypothetical protein
MIYTNLEQRMAKTYKYMFPPFVPDKQATISIENQEEFYNLMKSLYQLAFVEPLLFVPTLHEDDVYSNRFNKSSYGKPDLQVNMTKFTKAVDALLENMFLAGQGHNVKFSGRQQAILSRLGINSQFNLPAAWIWMATRPEADLYSFSHCFFNRNHSYTSDIYARLFGADAFHRLENWMMMQNYERVEGSGTAAAGYPVMLLNYTNMAWSVEQPKGGFLSKIKHTGISVMYDPFVEPPAVYGLCIPNALAPYLKAFDSMTETLQGFVVAHTKKCDGCRYCVQTDKTGLRPLACIPAAVGQKEYNLCPYFPGYSFCWTSIDNDLADHLIEMLSFMDTFLAMDTNQRI